MDIINNSELRIGNFTSSEIACLLSEPTAAAIKKGEIWGKPALTYINEKNMERRHGLPLSLDIDAKQFTWGKLCERYVHEFVLPLSYKYSSKDTLVHPDYDFWAGSPDGTKADKVGPEEGDVFYRTVTDIKCPMTRKSFSQMIDPLYKAIETNVSLNTAMWDCILDMRENHTSGEDYYWQLVSNAILTNSAFAELIVFMPTKKEIKVIREMAKEKYDAGEKQYYYIANAADEELPHIRDTGYYEPLNIIRFKVPESDIVRLTERVVMASKLLIERK